MSESLEINDETLKKGYFIRDDIINKFRKSISSCIDRNCTQNCEIRNSNERRYYEYFKKRDSINSCNYNKENLEKFLFISNKNQQSSINCNISLLKYDDQNIFKNESILENNIMNLNNDNNKLNFYQDNSKLLQIQDLEFDKYFNNYECNNNYENSKQNYETFSDSVNDFPPNIISEPYFDNNFLNDKIANKHDFDSDLEIEISSQKKHLMKSSEENFLFSFADKNYCISEKTINFNSKDISSKEKNKKTDFRPVDYIDFKILIDCPMHKNAFKKKFKSFLTIISYKLNEKMLEFKTQNRLAYFIEYFSKKNNIYHEILSIIVSSGANYLTNTTVYILKDKYIENLNFLTTMIPELMLRSLNCEEIKEEMLS